jgi:hypothetical protein
MAKNIIDSIYVVKSTSLQRILDRNRTVVAPVDYKDILKMEGTRVLPHGALPLATTVKCEFVAHTTSLSRSEPLARAASAADGSAAAEKEAATGEPDGSRHNNELIFS